MSGRLTWLLPLLWFALGVLCGYVLVPLTWTALQLPLPVPALLLLALIGAIAAVRQQLWAYRWPLAGAFVGVVAFMFTWFLLAVLFWEAAGD